MTDVFDQASEREDRDRALAIEAARGRADGPYPCGACYNCGETLQGDMRFCDLDCRDDWQARQGRG